LPCFQSNNVVDARHHVKRVSHFFNKWCCDALHEDIKMKLFILSFDDDNLDWFMKFKDNQVETCNELIDAFMEKWKEKESTDIKTVSSDNKDASPDSNKKFKEVMQAMEFIYAKQLKAMEASLAEIEACVEYSDLVEPEFPREPRKKIHLEIPEEPIDESVIDQEETKEIEFEVVEYLDNSTPHPPPNEPIFSEKIFNIFNENIEADSLTVPVPTSQPSDDLITNNGKMEDNFSLSIPHHYE
jgi:hypothetical protein